MTIQKFKNNWQPKLDEYAQFNFNLDLKELEEQIRADTIEECIDKIKKDHPHTDNHYDVYEAIRLLKELKEIKNG